MGRLSDEIIEDIREASDIVELISEYVPLKKQGKNFVGLCPFHEEKKPSFSVNPERQIFHCFGCGTGGNIFKFLMEYQKMNFLDAVRFLAERAHIDLPARDRAEDRNSEYAPLYKANHLAAAHYHQQLVDSIEAEKARRYLQERGLSADIMKTFRLGYAPPGWDGLIRRAQRHGISTEVLYRAGLILKREYGQGYYDRFRDRLIFPITNASGKFIGFGGRVLQESDEVKYINSPETPIYQKGKTLYGLFQTGGAIRKAGRVLIVEGYTDLLSLVQVGIGHVVASLGTALTSHQARLLSRYTREAVLLYDADSAGVAAAGRGVDVLLGAGVSVQVSSLPTGMDPDQAVREKGREWILDQLDHPETFLDFKLRHLLQREGASSVPGKAETIEEIGRTIGCIDDPIRKGLYIRETAERLSVDERLIALAVDRAAAGPRRRQKTGIRTEEQVLGEAELPERKILALLLQNPMMVSNIQGRITAEDFSREDYRQIIQRLLEEGDHVQRPAQLMNSLSDLGLESTISELCFLEEKGQVDVLIEDHVRKLEERRFQKEQRNLQNQIREAEKKGNHDLADKLSQRLQQISQKRYESTSTNS